MPRCKGSNIIFIRKLLHDTGPEAEQAFEHRLSSEEAHLFRTALAISWIPVETMAHYFDVLAEVVYPGNPRGLREIGKGLAHHNLTGVYKFFVKIASVPFVIQQCAAIWSVYQEQGKPSAVQDGDGRGRFVVEDFPELPASFREEISGFLEGVLEMTGARQIQVVQDPANPKSWVWNLRWS